MPKKFSKNTQSDKKQLSTGDVENEEMNDNKAECWSDDESVYSLLSDDCSSGEEEILGGSFNLPYQKKFVPGNKIHKQLAWYQNTYREAFYKEHKGVARFQGDFVEYYDTVKNGVYEEQEKMKSTKEERKGKFAYKEDYVKDKTLELKKCMGTAYILTLKEGTDEAKVYPNFALAKLSYVTEERVHSKCLVVNRCTREGHAEDQIFQQALTDLQAENKYQKADLVLLDINTALSMCESCYKKANIFIKEASEVVGQEVSVRVSYNFPYNKCEVQSGGEGLLQKQIEIPEVPFKSKSFYQESVVISNGYTSSQRQKDAVSKVDQLFLSERLKTEFSLYNEVEPEIALEVPEGFQDVEHDGLCFYHAVALLENRYTAEELRTMAIGRILNNPVYYQDFITGLNLPVRGFAEMTPQQAVEAYVNYHMRHYEGDANTWADHLMIQAVADVLQVNIQVQMFDQHGMPQVHQDGVNQGNNIIFPFIGEGATADALPLVIGNLNNLHFVAGNLLNVVVDNPVREDLQEPVPEVVATGNVETLLSQAFGEMSLSF